MIDPDSTAIYQQLAGGVTTSHLLAWLRQSNWGSGGYHQAEMGIFGRGVTY
jgi:hypothetical protein